MIFLFRGDYKLWFFQIFCFWTLTVLRLQKRERETPLCDLTRFLYTQLQSLSDWKATVLDLQVNFSLHLIKCQLCDRISSPALFVRLKFCVENLITWFAYTWDYLLTISFEIW